MPAIWTPDRRIVVPTRRMRTRRIAPGLPHWRNRILNGISPQVNPSGALVIRQDAILLRDTGAQCCCQTCLYRRVKDCITNTYVNLMVLATEIVAGGNVFEYDGRCYSVHPSNPCANEGDYPVVGLGTVVTHVSCATCRFKRCHYRFTTTFDCLNRTFTTPVHTATACNFPDLPTGWFFAGAGVGNCVFSKWVMSTASCSSSGTCTTVPSAPSVAGLDDDEFFANCTACNTCQGFGCQPPYACVNPYLATWVVTWDIDCATADLPSSGSASLRYGEAAEVGSGWFVTTNFETGYPVFYKGGFPCAIGGTECSQSGCTTTITAPGGPILCGTCTINSLTCEVTNPGCCRTGDPEPNNYCSGVASGCGTCADEGEGI